MMKGCAKKEHLRFGWAVLIAFVLVAFGTAGPGKITWATASEAPIKLLIAHWEGPGGAKATACRPWAKELERRSGGRIKTEIVYGGVMGKPPEHYDLAVRGVCDIAQVGLPFSPGRFPMSEIWDMPFNRGELSGEDLSLIFLRLLEKGYFDKDFKDAVIVGVNAIGPYHFQMRKDIVLAIQDLKGKKIRVTGKAHTELMKVLGAIPIGMPGSQIYTALEKGIVDGVFTDWSAVVAFRYEHLTKHVTVTPMCGMGFVYAMNKRKFDSLPKDLQDLIISMRVDFTRLLGQVDDDFSKKGKQLVVNAGGKIHKFPKAELQKMKRLVGPVWQKWISEGEKRGLPRRELVRGLAQMLKEKGITEPFWGLKL